MTTANSRTMIIISSIAFLGLLLARCGGPRGVAATVPAGATAGDLGLGPCTYKAGDMEYAADCGTLVVPENRFEPNARLLALPVIRVRATSDSPAEPIFHFSGGPGTSNLGFQHLADVIGTHDVVQVGYRGIDGSVVLDCREISEAVRKARALLVEEALGGCRWKA